MKYQWVLFDADETLFHFDNYAGLVRMFAPHGVHFSKADFDEYQSINKPLWVAYQEGKINADQLQTRRFQSWSERLAISAKELNKQFLDAMAEICQTLPGALELVTYLHQHKVKMAIITNGFTQLQQVRLERTGFHTYFSPVITSEQVGVAKPNVRLFEHALEKMGSPNKNQVLMVGDTLESDILGGINVGLDTCWLNHHNKTPPLDIMPTYQVTSLMKLLALLKDE